MAVFDAVRSVQGRMGGIVLSLFRVVVGLLFTSHGVASLFGAFGGAYGGGTIPTGSWPGWYAAVIQLVGGALVTIGLGTRIAALICSGSMAYAYFVVHLPLGPVPLQNGGEASAMFCWSFFLIAVFGGGPIALDALIRRRNEGAAVDGTRGGVAGRRTAHI